jgi:hypothetical protein
MLFFVIFTLMFAGLAFVYVQRRRGRKRQGGASA